MDAVVLAVARRTSLPGAEVQLLVVACGRRWCAAVDLDSGALLSVRWAGDPRSLAPLVLARGRVADDQGIADPMRPEDVVLREAPRPTGRMGRRRSERWLRPLLHPEGEHLLGFAGPAIPYWTLTGDRPSVAVVAPSSRPVVLGGTCRFYWRNAVHLLPVMPGALDSSPARPRRFLIALSAPRDGHCYKVVASLL